MSAVNGLLAALGRKLYGGVGVKVHSIVEPEYLSCLSVCLCVCLSVCVCSGPSAGVDPKGEQQDECGRRILLHQEIRECMAGEKFCFAKNYLNVDFPIRENIIWLATFRAKYDSKQ